MNARMGAIRVTKMFSVPLFRRKNRMIAMQTSASMSTIATTASPLNQRNMLMAGCWKTANRNMTTAEMIATIMDARPGAPRPLTVPTEEAMTPPRPSAKR